MNDLFRGRIIDITDDVYTIEITGDADEVEAFLQALKSKTILETVRTGVSGITRGDKAVMN